MPCRDYYDDHPNQYCIDIQLPDVKKKLAFAETALCALIKAVDNIPLASGQRGRAHVSDIIDYKEAGITKEEFLSWMKNHEKQDHDRRVKEEIRKSARKAELQAMLSDEDKELLGIKSK